MIMETMNYYKSQSQQISNNERLFSVVSGYLTQGQYFVTLPDGRLQTVTYHADENGYVADVTYTNPGVAVAAKPSYSS